MLSTVYFKVWIWSNGILFTAVVICCGQLVALVQDALWLHVDAAGQHDSAPLSRQTGPASVA